MAKVQISKQYRRLFVGTNENQNLYIMSKYSEKTKEIVKETIDEMKAGKLKSGSGKKVTSRKQAIAIGLSEARRAGAKVPRQKD